MTQLELQSILYLAASEPIGLLLRSVSPSRDGVRQALYAARTAAADPQLADLQIRVSPFPEGDLLLCRRQIAVRPPAATPAEDELL